MLMKEGSIMKRTLESRIKATYTKFRIMRVMKVQICLAAFVQTYRTLGYITRHLMKGHYFRIVVL